MGWKTDAKIRAWQEANGIEPATGRNEDLLQKMSNAAFYLIKIIELERSGIRDGDGYWHGSDVMGHVTGDLVSIIERYELARKTAEVPHAPQEPSEGDGF